MGNSTNHKVIDLTGQRFGRYIVLSQAESQVYFDGKRNRTRTMWNCKCDCGNEKVVSSHSLRSGHVVSCGCYKEEVDHTRCMTHGATLNGKPTRLYKVWDGMKARCYNPNKAYYSIYGGRGITMCDEWHYSFEKFRDWALANGYKDGLTIDRINNDGNYCPENCRWATVSQQNNNKSTNHYLTYNGETKTIMQWAEATGFPFHAILARVKKGMSAEYALLTPLRTKGKGHYEYLNSKLVNASNMRKEV